MIDILLLGLKTRLNPKTKVRPSYLVYADVD
jgi:hypothetical protein